MNRQLVSYETDTWLLTGSWLEKASCAGEESLLCLLLLGSPGAPAWPPIML